MVAAFNSCYASLRRPCSTRIPIRCRRMSETSSCLPFGLGGLAFRLPLPALQLWLRLLQRRVSRPQRVQVSLYSRYLDPPKYIIPLPGAFGSNIIQTPVSKAAQNGTKRSTPRNPRLPRLMCLEPAIETL